MEDKSKKVIDAIIEYQVSGCVSEFDENNFNQEGISVAWSDHYPGTMATGIGSFFLGMPKGFDRLGHRFEDSNNRIRINIFTNYAHLESAWPYNMYNIPCWKHLNSNGHVLVRGLMPRINTPFLHIILENCLDKINCIEITKKEIDEMD